MGDAGDIPASIASVFVHFQVAEIWLWFVARYFPFAVPGFRGVSDELEVMLGLREQGVEMAAVAEFERMLPFGIVRVAGGDGVAQAHDSVSRLVLGTCAFAQKEKMQNDDEEGDESGEEKSFEPCGCRMANHMLVLWLV